MATDAPACKPSWADYQTVFTNAKAGMEGVDKAHVQRVVYEMSKDSAHFKNEQRKQAQTELKIARMKEKAAQLTPQALEASGRAMDLKVAELESGRDLSRTWLVVDMDAFFAAVEERDNPGMIWRALRHARLHCPQAVPATALPEA
ncbi:UmuC domain-containing protein [Haematococcus lacustris]|uniref:UmuC domain-containing protein n=1 Tax=Haematococcus lacustris TaxID=44745 RepID=A0A699YP17_HAELA|nr:UmuC domain-containing protein [Haematococcus lacustris]